MELYKIIASKKHFYESKRAYEKGLRYHIKYLETVKSYLDYLTIECYQIGARDGDICWNEIDNYEISDGEVISCYGN